MSVRLAAQLPFAPLLLAAALPAQTLGDLRDALRDGMRSARMTALLSGFVDMSETDELSSASIRIHDSPALDLSTYKLPYQRDYALGEGLPELHLAAGLGGFVGRTQFDDLWNGGLPGLETRVRSRWRGLSGHLGAGPRFDLGSGLHATVMADSSLSYLENSALYEGPGAGITSQLMDGILFNWHTTTFAYGGALRVEHDAALTGRTGLHSLLRYDLRRFEGVHSTDPAQDAHDTIQRLVARTGIDGPSGMQLFARDLDWNAHVAYTRYLGRNDDILGFVDYFELGAGLKAPLRIGFVPFSVMTISAAWLVGEDLRGWTIGVGVEF